MIKKIKKKTISCLFNKQYCSLSGHQYVLHIV